MRMSVRIAGVLGCIIIAAIARSGSAAAADGGVSAADLEAGKEVIMASEPTRMWECWEAGAGSAPRLYQWVGDKWQLLDVASTKRDVATCGSSTPIKAVYNFTLFPVGTLNQAKDYYEARMLTKCKGCETYRWKIPYRHTDAVF